MGPHGDRTVMVRRPQDFWWSFEPKNRTVVVSSCDNRTVPARLSQGCRTMPVRCLKNLTGPVRLSCGNLTAAARWSCSRITMDHLFSDGSIFVIPSSCLHRLPLFQGRLLFSLWVFFRWVNICHPQQLSSSSTSVSGAPLVQPLGLFRPFPFPASTFCLFGCHLNQEWEVVLVWYRYAKRYTMMAQPHVRRPCHTVSLRFLWRVEKTTRWPHDFRTVFLRLCKGSSLKAVNEIARCPYTM